jgi:hypothetical protein
MCFTVTLLSAGSLALCACGGSGATSTEIPLNVSQALARGDQDEVEVIGDFCGASSPSASRPMYLSGGELSTDQRPCPRPRLIVRGLTLDDVAAVVPDQYLFEQGDTFRTIWPASVSGDLRGNVLTVDSNRTAP